MPIRSLRRLVVATAIAVGLLSAAGTASAGTIASAILLSTDANSLDCFLSNVGTKAVSITSVQINNGGNTILALSTNTCDTLVPGQNCTFSAGLDTRFSARAVVVFRGKAQALRGQCQLTTSTNHLVASTELH